MKLNSNLLTNTKDINYENGRTSEDAFMVLIKGIKKEDLSNLCTYFKNHLKQNYNLDLTLDNVYDLTQSSKLKPKYKKELLENAYKCIDDGLRLGNNTSQDGKINTSSWISHLLFEGRLCAELASKIGLNPDTAKKVGILHDYGRKYSHGFDHILIGYEKLKEISWDEEAISCITHSFVNGNRCANNEVAEDGFYVDEQGNAKWMENTQKDDVTLFLENYNYNEYDDILTIADLMATNSGIVSPLDRINDIATRRKLDPKNRAYFISEFINKLNEFMVKSGSKKSYEKIKPTKDISLESMMDIFKNVSDEFYDNYTKMIENEEISI